MCVLEQHDEWLILQLGKIEPFPQLTFYSNGEIGYTEHPIALNEQNLDAHHELLALDAGDEDARRHVLTVPGTNESHFYRHMQLFPFSPYPVNYQQEFLEKDDLD